MSSEPKLTMYDCLTVPKGDWRNVFELQSLRMVLIHNVLIRSFNSMLYYSGEVKAGTKQFSAFLTYCEAGNRYLHHHHHIEEKYWFPFLEQQLGADCMKENKDDHHELMAKFDIFEELIRRLRKDPSKFDVATFRAAIHVFVPDLIEHLKTEPDTFTPEILKAKIKEEDLKKCEVESEKEIIASFSLTEDAQLFLVNGDAVNSWFPPVPAPLLLLVKYVTWYAHPDVWVYGSCDRHMQVKPQFAQYEPPKTL